MIRVKIELVPFGDESKVTTIGELKIVNDGTGTKDIGNYIFEAKDIDDIGCGLSQMYIIAQGQVKNHNRATGVWPLLKVIFGSFDV